MSNLDFYEKCPRCQSLNCVTDLSTRETKCQCGFVGNISEFREHDNFEKIKSKAKDLFGYNLPETDEQLNRVELLKNLDSSL